MAKKLTQKQAWMKMARLWDKAVYRRTWSCHTVKATNRADISCGLCSTVHQLYYAGLIGLGLHNKLEEKIQAGIPHGQEWMASLNKAGAKVRTKFCLEQARRLKR